MDNSSLQGNMMGVILDLPWLSMLGELWRVARKMFRGFSNEGIYEVLDYECTLEIQDRNGYKALFQKHEVVRYLQDYIMAYEDQGWGDGEIFLDYRCSPGVPVDEFRLGHKILKLISLRQFRNKGDVDDYHIEWKIQNRHRKSTGSWGTSINHRTKKVTVRVIFPKGRPPIRCCVTESSIQRTYDLRSNNQLSLPDGRTMIVWECSNPRLYEDYILNWEW